MTMYVDLDIQIAGLTIANAPVHVYGNGSRGDMEDGQKQIAFEEGKAQACKMLKYDVGLNVDFDRLSMLHHEKYEEELREMDNERSKIDYGKYGRAIANALKYQIPSDKLKELEARMAKVFPYCVV